MDLFESIATRRWFVYVRLAGMGLWAATTGLIVFGAAKGGIAAVPAGLVALFASLAILFALETFRSLEAGEGFAVESHWGGLGGGLGGWRISRPLIFLTAALVCAGLTFAVADPHLQSPAAGGITDAASPPPTKQPEAAAEEPPAEAS